VAAAPQRVIPQRGAEDLPPNLLRVLAIDTKTQGHPSRLRQLLLQGVPSIGPL
jgi:hypothetical protein